ncbi:MAG: phosphoribosylglycinamide formyltransferase [Bacillota bacterium]
MAKGKWYSGKGGADLLKIGVLASGRGSNLQAIIDAVERGELPAKISVVISDKEGAPALDRARRHGIEACYLNPRQYVDKEEFERGMISCLHDYGIELVALAGYMRVLTPVMINAFPGRIVNIHPSLLPAFPGLEAQRQALAYGVKYTGCTVHFVDSGMDTGPIIAQAAVPVETGDTAVTLAERILVQEHRLYPLVLRWIAEDRLSLDGRRVHIRG